MATFTVIGLLKPQGLNIELLEKVVDAALHVVAKQGRGGGLRWLRGRGFGLPPRGCVACVNVLASFMSERATGSAFFRSYCVGGVGTSAASTEWFAGKEASNAHGTTP